MVHVPYSDLTGQECRLGLIKCLRNSEMYIRQPLCTFYSSTKMATGNFWLIKTAGQVNAERMSFMAVISNFDDERLVEFNRVLHLRCVYIESNGIIIQNTLVLSTNLIHSSYKLNSKMSWPR